MKKKQKGQKKQQSHVHHYVPQWYQRRFLLSGQTNFFYLDLHPETITWPGGSHTLKAMRPRGPTACFCQDDLYTLRFGRQTTDEMERLFFGMIDAKSQRAVEHFAEYGGIAEGTSSAFDSLTPYMGAQRFRTPRALDLIKKRLGAPRHNAALAMLHNVFQKHTTMWAEGVWEIVRAKQSPTKFLVTDDPVTFYCKHVFPSEWPYPNEISLRQTGTRTIFSLGMDSCLIITHLQLVRNPWSSPVEPRTNARDFDTVMKFMGAIQFGRDLDEDEVLRINYICKRRASRYVAAAEEEWLYPERRVSTTDWAKLDDDWFLFPNLWRVGFTTGIAAGGGKGRPYAADEYGFKPWQPEYQDKARHDRDWVTFERAKREWAVKRLGRSRAQTDEHMGRDVGDKIMDDFLREQGLLYGPMERPYDWKESTEVER